MVEFQAFQSSAFTMLPASPENEIVPGNAPEKPPILTMGLWTRFDRVEPVKGLWVRTGSTRILEAIVWSKQVGGILSASSSSCGTTLRCCPSGRRMLVSKGPRDAPHQFCHSTMTVAYPDWPGGKMTRAGDLTAPGRSVGWLLTFVTSSRLGPDVTVTVGYPRREHS